MKYHTKVQSKYNAHEKSYAGLNIHAIDWLNVIISCYDVPVE